MSKPIFRKKKNPIKTHVSECSLLNSLPSMLNIKGFLLLKYSIYLLLCAFHRRSLNLSKSIKELQHTKFSTSAETYSEILHCSTEDGADEEIIYDLVASPEDARHSNQRKKSVNSRRNKKLVQESVSRIYVRFKVRNCTL